MQISCEAQHLLATSLQELTHAQLCERQQRLVQFLVTRKNLYPKLKSQYQEHLKVTKRREAELLLENGGVLPTKDAQLDDLRKLEQEAREELSTFDGDASIEDIARAVQSELTAREDQLRGTAKQRFYKRWGAKEDECREAAKKAIVEYLLAWHAARTSNPLPCQVERFLDVALGLRFLDAEVDKVYAQETKREEKAIAATSRGHYHAVD